ncbi:MAG: hypothetical protein KGS72_27420 [Cyanobacteria bacterium REEB67]|nr:hypothetical protein [Cyanobacteria bacterium REEB67]
MKLAAIKDQKTARRSILALMAACLLICFSAKSTKAQSPPTNPTSTTPSATDSAIRTFDDAHLSWTPYTTPRHELLLFLPGTAGKPHRTQFLETAASLGYHVIFLMYPDDIAAQQACANSDDPNAYMQFRLAIIEGGNYSDRTNISRADSIDSRLRHLLRYLDSHQPGQGWSTFLEADGAPKWSSIAVAGQSQGGGHAYVISKIHPVARVIFFGSPKDYSFRFRAPAGGFDSNTKTPLSRYFAFNHIEDRQGGCNHEQQMEIFKKIGLTTYGIADADHPTPAYNRAHLIFTDGQLADMSQMPQIHNFAVNNATVLSSSGKPICPPVWNYLLTEPVK